MPHIAFAAGEKFIQISVKEPRIGQDAVVGCDRPM